MHGKGEAKLTAEKKKNGQGYAEMIMQNGYHAAESKWQSEQAEIAAAHGRNVPEKGELAHELMCEGIEQAELAEQNATERGEFAVAEELIAGEGEEMGAKQEKKGKKACILCIDGGGMRGIIPAKVLCYVEEKIKQKTGDPNARVADYFDIIAGTSVGGLIATMMCADDGQGRPLFSAMETCRLIADKGKLIFKIPKLRRPFAKLRGILTPRYSVKHMEGILKEHLVRDGRELTLKDTLKPLLIPCYDLSRASAYVFSRSEALKADGNDYRLTDICRATSAVPGFFRPAIVTSVDGKTGVVGIDGGLVMNNPSAAAVTHTLHNHDEFPHVRSVGDMLLLSLGTGLFDRVYEPGKVRRWGAFQWAKPVARIVLDGISDMVDHSMSMAFSNHRENYLRIQVSGIPGRWLTEMDNPSTSNVLRLTKIAEDMLGQSYMEHIPFGGKRKLEVSNQKCLDRFIDQLIAEHCSRLSSATDSHLRVPSKSDGHMHAQPIKAPA